MLGAAAQEMTGDSYEAKQNKGGDALWAAHIKGGERRVGGHARPSGAAQGERGGENRHIWNGRECARVDRIRNWARHVAAGP